MKNNDRKVTTNEVNETKDLTITENTTLGELLKLLNLGEKPCETPTPKKLRENAGKPVAFYPMSDVVSFIQTDLPYTITAPAERCFGSPIVRALHMYLQDLRQQRKESCRIRSRFPMKRSNLYRGLQPLCS